MVSLQLLHSELTWRQRMWGFVLCFCIGTALSIWSSMYVHAILSHHPHRFAVPYTFGNLCSLFSTSFLVGPSSQIQSMFEKKRRFATLTYLITLCATLFVALNGGNALVVLSLIVVQACALIWYGASYVPFAQDILTKCLASCCDCLITI
eukprot:TRINITY_DN18793_c0_g1_i2.p2 TRINITY_DN18793_c0_g1~~TRINITY_DN18793_c0_g1_i2.p2  ORF type:complete len:150 (-),score=41.46 TRINITY_DN18793_c0_g1_i2:48-497(-)